MADDVRISQLPDAAAIGGGELLPIVQGGISRKATLGKLLSAASWGGTATGSATAMVIGPTRLINQPHEDGQRLQFVAPSAATGAATLQRDGLAALPIVLPDGSAVPAGYWDDDALLEVAHVGGSFVLVSTPKSGAAGRAVLATATTDAAQDAIGATVTGKALITAAGAAGARTAIGAFPAASVSAFAETLLDDANAGAARATLGAAGLTGNETIAGAKNFSTVPTINSFAISRWRNIGRDIGVSGLGALNYTWGSSIRKVRVQIWQAAQTVAGDMGVRTITGASADAGVADYFDYGNIFLAGGTPTASPLGGNSSFVHLLSGLINANDIRLRAIIDMACGDSGKFATFDIESTFVNSTPAHQHSKIFGLRNTNGYRNGIQIFAGGGTFSGDFLCEGCE